MDRQIKEVGKKNLQSIFSDEVWWWTKLYTDVE